MTLSFEDSLFAGAPAMSFQPDAKTYGTTVMQGRGISCLVRPSVFLAFIGGKIKVDGQSSGVYLMIGMRCGIVDVLIVGIDLDVTGEW